jgi:hypothetical protein
LLAFISREISKTETPYTYSDIYIGKSKDGDNGEIHVGNRHDRHMQMHVSGDTVFFLITKRASKIGLSKSEVSTCLSTQRQFQTLD